MSLRPVPARWFEVLVVRDDLGAALDVLARSSRVELEAHGAAQAPLLDDAARALLEEFASLEERFGHYWPTPHCRRKPWVTSMLMARAPRATTRPRRARSALYLESMPAGWP